MKPVVAQAALAELHDAAAFYTGKAHAEPGLALVAEFERGADFLLANPLIGDPFRGTSLLNCRRTRGFVALVLLPLACSVFAQDKYAAAMAKLNVILPRDAEERLALSAAPEHLRADATAYVFGKSGFERTRSGSNGLTCLLNRDGFFYGGSQFKPTCWDAQGADSFVPVMLKTGEMLARGESFAAIKAAIDEGFRDQVFKAPATGGIAYMLAGDVDVDTATGNVTAQAFPGHYMFYANNATNAQLGFSREAAAKDASLPFVFSAGAGGDHGLSYVISSPGSSREARGGDICTSSTKR